MSLGPIQLIVIALLILVLFGRGRISEMMGDFGKGIRSFKDGMNEDEQAAKTPPAQISQQQQQGEPGKAPSATETREHS